MLSSAITFTCSHQLLPSKANGASRASLCANAMLKTDRTPNNEHKTSMTVLMFFPSFVSEVDQPSEGSLCHRRKSISKCPIAHFAQSCSTLLEKMHFAGDQTHYRSYFPLRSSFGRPMMAIEGIPGHKSASGKPAGAGLWSRTALREKLSGAGARSTHQSQVGIRRSFGLQSL